MDSIEDFNNTVSVAYLNCRGQTGLYESKQLQIEKFLQNHNIDILHLQETHLEDETFSGCNYISSNFNIIHNNSITKYGTASLVRSTLEVENIILHESGRLILFDIGGVTFGNVYLPSGTDGSSRSSREKFCGETIPTLLINCKTSGIVGGDWNCIINAEDCTKHPDANIQFDCPEHL